MEACTQETVKELLLPLLEKDFVFSYRHEKGGDSACSYISRFQKGKDYFEWREVSGSDEINLVVYVRGGYDFPTVKSMDKKKAKQFSWKHIFKRPTMQEKRIFYAKLVIEQANGSSFFGIPL